MASATSIHKYRISSNILSCGLSELLFALNLSLLVCAAIYLRGNELDHLPGVNADEALVAVQVADMMEGRPAVLMMPTGRLLSPVYGLALMFVKYFSPISFFSLRLPALGAGLLLLLFNFILFRGVLGKMGVLLSTLLMASSPVLIAYSRLGIEQSLLPLSSLFCVYFALKGRPGFTLIAFIVALLTHPVSIFLLPALLFPLGSHFYLRYGGNQRQRWGFIGVFALVAAVAIIGEASLLPEKYRSLLTLNHLIAMCTEGSTLITFWGLVLRLLNGLTAFAQFSGRAPAAFEAFWQAMSGLFAICILIMGSVSLWRKGNWLHLSFVFGTFISLCGYYLVTGDEGIYPGVARYAVWIPIPSFISFAILLKSLAESHSEKLSERPTRPSPYLLWGISVFAWAGFAQTQLFYFDQFHSTNTNTHESYWSGAKEPKKVAYEWILRDFGVPSEKHVLHLVAADWWSYWPLRYLALDQFQGGFKFYRFDTELENSQQVKALAEKGAYFVGFPGGNLQFALGEIFGVDKLKSQIIYGYGEKPVLAIFRMER